MKKKKRITGADIGIVLCAFVLCVCIGGLAFYTFRDIKLDERNKGWRDRFEITPETAPAKTETAPEQETLTAEYLHVREETEPVKEVDPILLREFDFPGMWEENKEIVAWLYIPDTQIDYPVCQHYTDDYYLDHGPDGSYDYFGSIFLPAQLAVTDPHIVIYGHNMRSGKMFGELKKYREKEFFEEHPILYLYLPDRAVRAEIFSCYQTEVGTSAYTFNLVPGTAEYKSWIEEIKKESAYDTGVEVTEHDSVITLSTCVSRGIKEERYVVHAAVRAN